MTETTLILVFDCRLFEQHVTQADLVKKNRYPWSDTANTRTLFLC